MADREEIRERMRDDGVEFILAQFVDIHGSAKVKMVPVTSFDDVLDDASAAAGTSSGQPRASQITPDTPEEELYTSRLLKAKKKAWKERDERNDEQGNG